MSAKQDSHSGPGRSEDLPDGLRVQLAAALKNLRFGSVEIVIHDGRVVQIERKEKVRLDKPGSPGL